MRCPGQAPSIEKSILFRAIFIEEKRGATGQSQKTLGKTKVLVCSGTMVWRLVFGRDDL
jgi:hypothetical protein